MNLTPVIGVTGKKRHGKDTIADYLTSKRGYVRVALADELKRMVLDLDPLVTVPDSHTVGTDLHASECYRLSVLVERFGMEATKNIPEVRRLLQVMGTEVIRYRDPDFWIRTLHKRLTDLEAETGTAGLWVVPDIRYDNEAEWIKSLGGSVVQVVRPGVGDGDAHASEAGISTEFIDETVMNDGGVDDLFRRLDRLWL